MNPLLLVLAVGLAYILIIGGISLLRREGLSAQFAYEGLGVTGVTLIAMYGGGFAVHPLYFVIFLYLITMRVRLLVELGNQLSVWGRQRDALAVHHFALRLFPDKPTRLIVLVNVGAVYLKRRQPDRAIEVLEEAQAQIGAQLGSKYAAGCCYNLGMAYRRVGRRTEALQQFRAVGEIHPLSPYAQLAERAFEATLKDPITNEKTEGR